MCFSVSKLISRFKCVSGIVTDVSNAFIGFFVVTRCSQLGILNKNIETVVNWKKLVTEDREIYDLLELVNFDAAVRSMPDDKFIDVCRFVDKTIKSFGDLSQYTLGNLLLKVMKCSKDGITDRDILQKISDCQIKLNILTIANTEALLLIMGEEDKSLINNIIESYLESNINKIYIVSYNNLFNVADYENLITSNHYFSKEVLKEKVVYKSAPIKSFNYLQQVIKAMEENSFLIVIGTDRLTSLNTNQPAIKTHFENSELNLHTPDSINWRTFTIEMDKLYIQCESRNNYLTAVFSSDVIFNKDIIREIKNSSSDLDSFDIITMPYQTNNVLHDLFDLLKECNSQDFKMELDNNRHKIGEDNYNLFQAFSALNQEDYLSADQYFHELSDNVHPENFLILANLYIYNCKYNTALEILTRLYLKDRYLNNLMPAALETTSRINDDKLFLEWLNRAKEINDEDLVVIQYAANFYTDRHMYKESSNEWRRLFQLTGDVSFRLLADINLILNEIEQLNVEKIENIVGNYSVCYPELDNEVEFRLGLIISRNKKKYEKGLEHFLKIKADINTPYAYSSAVERLNIYKDKILKINMTDRAIPDKNLLLFANELIKDVPILTFKDKSNHTWSDIIENTFPYVRWKEILIQITLERLEEWSKIDENMFSTTKLQVEYTLEMAEQQVEIGSRNIYIPESNEEYCILTFYNAIALMEDGKPQLANDMAFTLFGLASTVENIFLKNTAIILGLVAWSNSNFKIGEEVESMVALTAAIDLAVFQGEIMLPFIFGLSNMIDFLYNNTTLFIVNPEKKEALIKLFDNPHIGLFKSKYYAIIKNYDKIIENKAEIFKQSDLLWKKSPNAQLIINVSKDDEAYFINEFETLVDAYYNIGLLNEAIQLIEHYKDTIILNLLERADISYKLFYKLAAILLEDDNFILSTRFILLAINNVDKLREVNHKRERAFVGKEANKIYRKYIEIKCKESITSVGESSGKLNGDLEFKRILVNIVPRAIIEQKQFNNENDISDEMEELRKRYNDLFFILISMKNKGINDESYHKKASEFFEIKEYLEKNHPSFKALPNYNTVEGYVPFDNYKSIKEKLGHDELLYQMILVGDYLIHNFLSRDGGSIVIETIDLQQYKNVFEVFIQDICKDDHTLESEDSIKDMVKVCDIISQVFIKPLYNYLETNNFKKLYFMPDLNVTYLNMNYMRYKDRWLTTYFNSIENIIDFNVPGNKINDHTRIKYNAHLIKKQDKSISKIHNMIKDKTYIEIVEGNESYISIDEPLKAFILVGHGVSEASGFNYLGAKSISKSRKENIDLNEYIKVNANVENMLIISCSSGTPINDYAERNNGVWASFLEKKITYILYCKWDVSTEYTKRLLEKILDYMKECGDSLSEALLKAQREMKSLHPLLWAGLEVWKNE